MINANDKKKLKELIKKYGHYEVKAFVDGAQDEDDGLRSGVVVELNIKRIPGWLYFLRNTDVWREPIKPGSMTTSATRAKIVAKCNFKRNSNYLYFLDSRGNISRAKRIKR